MTSGARQLLDAYDALGAEDRQQVVVEILQRISSSGELTDDVFEQTATEVFRAFDRTETAMASDSASKKDASV